MSTITLPNIRVSSDLTVKLKLKDSGVAIDWSTLSNIKVSIYSDAQRALAGRCGVSIDAEDSTLLVCTYAANKPQYVGVNRVIVQATYMGETKTYDKPAINFVRWTDDQEGQTITIDDPDIDVEIEVEDVSSSILDEAIVAALAAAERAEAAADAAEHMVDIHTGPQGPDGKSAYECAVEEGYVGTEEEWLASLNGTDGEDGAAAGFGTVTATVGATVGTPSVTVTTSGPDTAKNISFAFENLKGATGETGATPAFTIGTVTTGAAGSQASATITGTAAAPVLNLTIPKGDQGNTGSSVDYAYELVNNLTTNDSTKGLSAAMGVTLEGEVSQLEAKVTGFTRVTSASAGTIPYKFVAGRKYIVTNLLSSYVTISHRDTPDGASSDVKTVYGNQTVEYIPTSNGDYLRFGDPCDFTIEDTTAINPRLSDAENDVAELYDVVLGETGKMDSIYKKDIVSSASGSTAFPFVDGHEYYIINNGATVTLSFLDSGGNILGSTWNPGTNSSNIVTAPSGAVAIGYGAACNITIIDVNGLFYAKEQNPPFEIEKDYNEERVRTLYINTGVSIGDTVSLSPVTGGGTSVGYVIIPCHKFDRFRITSTGGGSARAYCFIDVNNKCVYTSPSGNSFSNKDIVAPCEGSLIVNSTDWSNFSVYGTKKSVQIKDLYTNLFKKKFVFASSTEYKPFQFRRGEKYAIYNLANKAITFSTRETSTSTNYVDVLNCNPMDVKVFTATGNAEYIKTGDAATAIVYKLDSVDGLLENLQAENGYYEKEKVAVDFTFEKDFLDVSADVATMDFTETREGCKTILEQVYAKFDSLVSSYSSYITKADLAQELGISYPAYASLNGSASGGYLATPTYKTYVYKLVSNNQYVNTNLQKKKKIVLVGGVHGNEPAAPFNLYLIAKALCEATHEDYFKLRSAFDIYIVPCLNGYGLYHETRQNANGVDVNRNYPTLGFAVAGSGTVDYTGPYGASEFETQLVIAMVNSYSPDLLIDHHNYAKIAWQFYSEVSDAKLCRIVHKSLADCSFSFVKNLPFYFGTSYKLFQDEAGSAPGVIVNTFRPSMVRWGYENGVDFSTTIEISQTINYTNGVYDSNTNDRYFSADVFKVGEFTLRNQLLHYGKYILG